MRRRGDIDLFRTALAAAAVASLFFAAFTGAARAEEPALSSPNYMITDAQFGAGASNEDCSDDYCASAFFGSTAAGLMESSNFRAHASGPNADEPLLEVAASGGLVNLGALDPGYTSTLTMDVSVRSYLSGGYVIQISGSPPSYQGHQLARLEEPAASQIGQEQFGINLMANSTPEVGADPVQVPSGDFSFGRVADDYAVPDQFMYEDGDIVAYSETDTGRTDYTISMILNISTTTPGGQYSSAFSAVVIPVY